MVARMPSKHTVTLTVTSLLSVLFTMVHLADDYSRGFSTGDLATLPVAPVLAIWVYATLVLGERRSGLVVILVMSLLASGLPVLHLMGRSGITGGATPKSAGALFFAWTLLVLGVTSACSVFLSVRGLWGLRAPSRYVPMVPITNAPRRSHATGTR
jgi:hypothetical protein